MVRFPDVRFLLPPRGGACPICLALADLLGEEERSERAEVSAVNDTHETLSPTPNGAAKPPCPPRVSVVIPARNEARNLPFVLSRLPADLFEVILVDGHSDDDTVGVATRCRADIRVVCQRGHGKGNALACGFAAARGEVIVALDADGSTDPAEIPRFVQALRRGADFVKGSRFAPGGGSADITTLRKWGNLALVCLVNVLFRTRYTDLCYGFNAFWAKCLPMLEVNCDGFEVETLLNLRAARSGLNVAEVPSFERPRLHGLSNLRAWPDGLRVLRTVLSEYLSPHLHQAVQWSELGEWSELAQWSELGRSEPGPEPVAQGIADRATVTPRVEAAAPVHGRAAWTSR
jgi:Glycosyl transferase family 2